MYNFYFFLSEKEAVMLYEQVRKCSIKLDDISMLLIFKVFFQHFIAMHIAFYAIIHLHSWWRHCSTRQNQKYYHR